MSLAIGVNEKASSTKSTSIAHHAISIFAWDATEVDEVVITGLALAMRRWQGSKHRIRGTEAASRWSCRTYSKAGSTKSRHQSQSSRRGATAL